MPGTQENVPVGEGRLDLLVPPSTASSASNDHRDARRARSFFHSLPSSPKEVSPIGRTPMNSRAAPAASPAALPLLSLDPPPKIPAETCQECSKKFNALFSPSKMCHHCGRLFCKVRAFVGEREVNACCRCCCC